MTRIKFPRVSTTTEKAFLLYHNNPYFTGHTITDLFGCAKSTTGKIKRIVRLEMAERGIKLYCEQTDLLDRDVLYELAGLDISKINRSYKMLKSAGPTL